MTTGIITGVCHGIEVDMVRNGQIQYDHNGKKALLGENSTCELVVMSFTGSFRSQETLVLSSPITPEKSLLYGWQHHIGRA